MQEQEPLAYLQPNTGETFYLLNAYKPVSTLAIITIIITLLNLTHWLHY